MGAAVETTLETDAGPGARGGKGRERRCIVARSVKPEAELIRFVRGPDGAVTIDLAAKLPGRGAWVSADRASIDTAARKGHFARAFEGSARASAELAADVEAALRRRILAGLGQARRAGGVTLGFDTVRGLLKTERPAYIVSASDGAADGRDKILALARAAWSGVPVCGVFDAAELGRALGRDAVVHAAVRVGPWAQTLAVDFGRLAGFVALAPPAWTTTITSSDTSSGEP